MKMASEATSEAKANEVTLSLDSDESLSPETGKGKTVDVMPRGNLVTDLN